MSIFNLTNAIHVLHTQYDASWVEQTASQNGVEAEVGLCLGNKILLIEISVEADERRVRVTEVHTADIPRVPIESTRPLHFQNETTRYLANPKVVEYVEQIKRDIGLS